MNEPYSYVQIINGDQMIVNSYVQMNNGDQIITNKSLPTSIYTEPNLLVVLFLASWFHWDYVIGAIPKVITVCVIRASKCLDDILVALSRLS